MFIVLYSYQDINNFQNERKYSVIIALENILGVILADQHSHAQVLLF